MTGLISVPVYLENRYYKISQNAIAELFTISPEVEKVYCQKLKYHDIAKFQQNRLFGGAISFKLKEDAIEATEKEVTITKYFKQTESLGGAMSLLCHLAQITHTSSSREKRLSSDIQDSLIRLSIGIENVDDLKQDIVQANAQLKFVNV